MKTFLQQEMYRNEFIELLLDIRHCTKTQVDFSARMVDNNDSAGRCRIDRI